MTYPVMMQIGIDSQVAAMTVAELDAAITALQGKKDALRKAFENLSACSPSPLPFTWEGLDAYISGLQSSISLRFRQLQVLEAARTARSVLPPANNLNNGKARIQDDDTSDEEQWEEQVDDDHVDMQVVQDKIGNGWKEDEDPGDKEEDVEEAEELETMDKIVHKTNDEEAREEGELEEAYEDQYTDTNEDEEVARTVSTVQGDRDEACTEEQGAEIANKVRSITSVQEEEVNQAPPGADEDLVAACASINTTKLFEFMCSSVAIQRQEYPLAMRHAPDAAALVLGVVKLFIRTKNPRTKRLCLNCTALIQCVQSGPAPAAEPSSGKIEQAKRVAKDWKEMIDNPGSYGDLNAVASWGLLWFLVSYNIASEFDTVEIIRLYAAVPRKTKKIKTVELCKVTKIVPLS
ncbi:hypothetical protein EJB05_05818, partial [Eragrostis curvula]